MLSKRQRQQFQHRPKDEEIIKTQIRLLKDFRPYVKSLLPPDCTMCEKCKSKRLIEQERNFQANIRLMEEQQKMSRSRGLIGNFGSSGARALPDINSNTRKVRSKSAGSNSARSGRLSKQHVMNPRLIRLQQTAAASPTLQQNPTVTTPHSTPIPH